ncbi:MAG: lysophospholipid acyltransferase family protein [Chloroflexi bacterium]|nr:lysophospholipid acyltransferase family protein [Chloroflexota bacterium]
MIQYWLWRVSLLIWRWLPPAVGYRLADFVGDVAYFAWPKGRTYARSNMGRVLGSGADRRTVGRAARQSLRNYCRYLVDFIRFPLLRWEDIQNKVRFDGWENFDRALAGGKGAIFVGLHLGNWDLAAAAIAFKNYPLNVVAETFGYPPLNRLVQEARRQRGMKVIPLERAAAGVVRALRRNEVLAFLIDHPSLEAGVRVNFFGAPIQVPSGAAVLAMKTGAKLVPGALVRLPNDTFLGWVGEFVDIRLSGDFQADVQTTTQQVMDSLEAMVRHYPDQWFAFRRMWA